jgi:hypothetical protein
MGKGAIMKPIKIALLASIFAFTAGAASAQSLEGTARLHYTTSAGVSNFTHNKSCANSPCAAYVLVTTTAPRRHRR